MHVSNHRWGFIIAVHMQHFHGSLGIAFADSVVATLLGLKAPGTFNTSIDRSLALKPIEHY